MLGPVGSWAERERAASDDGGEGGGGSDDSGPRPLAQVLGQATVPQILEIQRASLEDPEDLPCDTYENWRGQREIAELLADDDPLGWGGCLDKVL